MTGEYGDVRDEVILPEETGETETLYYIVGKRPIKVTFVDDYPEYVYAFDFEKKEFVFDPSVMKQISDSLDVRRVEHNDFVNACLALGAKPI